MPGPSYAWCPPPPRSLFEHFCKSIYPFLLLFWLRLVWVVFLLLSNQSSHQKKQKRKKTWKIVLNAWSKCYLWDWIIQYGGFPLEITFYTPYIRILRATKLSKKSLLKVLEKTEVLSNGFYDYIFMLKLLIGDKSSSFIRIHSY